MAGRDRGIERRKADQILAAGKRDAGQHGKLRPVFRRIVGRDRLFDPVQRELAERLDRRPRGRKVPALIGIDHEPLALLKAGRDLADIRQIAFQIEGDLQLEGAVAALATHGDVFGRTPWD